MWLLTMDVLKPRNPQLMWGPVPSVLRRGVCTIPNRKSPVAAAGSEHRQNVGHTNQCSHCWIYADTSWNWERHCHHWKKCSQSTNRAPVAWYFPWLHKLLLLPQWRLKAFLALMMLAPLLAVLDSEVDAFWCFVGYMDMVVSLWHCCTHIYS